MSPVYDRFHDIAWSPPSAEHPKGIIAGALDNGSLDLWDAGKLLEGSDDVLISRTSKHTAAIKSLEFNPLKPQILATAGAKGELYIYDVNDVSNPYRLGNPQARSDDLECLAWNRKVPHILATGSVGGFVTVWDLKTKKASLNLNNNRRAVGAIAWDPNNATKLLTATPDDSNPAILLWDLRNSNAPERTLQGHEQGVLSLSWCKQDSNLLLSSGKDNRTLCWNPQTGELSGEFPEATNWTFQTRFNPHHPDLTGTASFDGKITINTLQSVNQPTSQALENGSADAEDFFSKAQSQPQASSFSLKRAPKWLERPVGASFGFGGKLVIFHADPAPASGRAGLSKVQITQFVPDSGIGAEAEAFEESLKEGNVANICQSRIASATSDEEIAEWKVLKSLLADNVRKSVTEYLGFSELGETPGVAGDEVSSEAPEGQEVSTDDAAAVQTKQSRLSTFFGDITEGDDFLAGITPTKAAKTNDPFHLLAETESTVDRDVTKALMLGQFETAMNICLKEDRVADAFVIANCGGNELLNKAQKEYLARASRRPNYLRLLAAVIGKNLWDVVYNADLADWKETMATLCTYADPKEFPDLCEALGDRMQESGSRKDASFCYIVGSKLEKVVNIWIAELEEQEQAGLKTSSNDSSFSLHSRSLQNFIEKVTVFRNVAKFQDSGEQSSSGWKLSSLYEKYVEYAEILASHGLMNSAEKYLELLPAKYSEADLTRSRVKQALTKPKTAANARGQQLFTQRGVPSAQLPVMPTGPRALQAVPPTLASNPYAPVSSLAPVAPYTPAAPTPYAPTQNFGAPQAQPAYGAPPSSLASVPQPSAYGQFSAPPRQTPPPPQGPPRAKDVGNWNDTPMVTKPAVSRRSTPSLTPAPTASPFQNQPSAVGPPPSSAFGAPRAHHTPPPPPPKGPAPPRMASPLTMSSTPPPTSRVSSAYAPPLAQDGLRNTNVMPPSTIARGPSPYNPPPTGPPPSNRYAPAPATSTPVMSPPAQIPPPPLAGSRGPPPSNPYAPSAPPSQATYPQGPPKQSFNSESHVPSPPRPESSQSQPPRSSASAVPKHPPGDRSHIPPSAQQMVDIFTSDMQRVAGKAPPSFAAQVKDTQKRLNILFDHLNNHDLIKEDTIARLSQLALALQNKDYDTAAKMQVDVQREKLDECGNWMVSRLDFSNIDVIADRIIFRLVSSVSLA
jgi:protein transport protein SEC31